MTEENRKLEKKTGDGSLSCFSEYSENQDREPSPVFSRMISEKFPQFKNRIAVGIAGEGSDCFGYDDFMSRDHDFGTGVCLWLTDEDMKEFGHDLQQAYDDVYEDFVRTNPESAISKRLRERRGVMTVHDYSWDRL